MIKNLLMLSAATAALSGGARAADLRPSFDDTPRAYAPPPVRAFDWTGAYIGANVGYGSGSDLYEYEVAGVDQKGKRYDKFGAERMQATGAIGGVQVGYNYGFGGIPGYGTGNFVIGAEADFDGTSIRGAGNLAQFAGGFPIGIPNNVDVASRIETLGTVRGRLGYAFDRVMVYGTGGFAYGDVRTSVSSPNNGVQSNVSRWHYGYAAGGGVEIAVTNHVMLRGEYLHADLGSKTVLDSGTKYLSYKARVRPEADIIRAGLDYKFDFAAAAPAPLPVIARY